MRVVLAILSLIVITSCNTDSDFELLVQNDFSKRMPGYEVLSTEIMEEYPEAIRVQINYKSRVASEVSDTVWEYLNSKEGWILNIEIAEQEMMGLTRVAINSRYEQLEMEGLDSSNYQYDLRLWIDYHPTNGRDLLWIYGNKNELTGVFKMLTLKPDNYELTDVIDTCFVYPFDSLETIFSEHETTSLIDTFLVTNSAYPPLEVYDGVWCFIELKSDGKIHRKQFLYDPEREYFSIDHEEITIAELYYFLEKELGLSKIRPAPYTVNQ